MVIRDARPAAVVHVPEQAESVVWVVVTVDCEAETPVVPTVTVAVCVMPVAEMVFVSTVVELSVQVATPLALAVCVRLTGDVVLLLPEIAIVTLELGTGLPN